MEHFTGKRECTHIDSALAEEVLYPAHIIHEDVPVEQDAHPNQPRRPGSISQGVRQQLAGLRRVPGEDQGGICIECQLEQVDSRLRPENCLEHCREICNITWAMAIFLCGKLHRQLADAAAGLRVAFSTAALARRPPTIVGQGGNLAPAVSGCRAPNRLAY